MTHEEFDTLLSQNHPRHFAATSDLFSTLRGLGLTDKFGKEFRWIKRNDNGLLYLKSDGECYLQYFDCGTNAIPKASLDEYVVLFCSVFGAERGQHWQNATAGHFHKVFEAGRVDEYISGVEKLLAAIKHAEESAC